MNVSNAKTKSTLDAVLSPTRAGSIGSITISSGSKTDYTTADIAYQTQYILAGTTTAATLDLTTGNAGGDAWVTPVHQVETATAAGTITTAGDATITVTAAGLTGSPLALTVAVALSDTPTLWAVKVRAALSADAATSAMFDVSGATDAIILTRKPLATYALGSDSIGMAYANDATLNVAIANDTSVGITAAATSANTTSGVLGDGAYIANDDIDFEGIALASPSAVYAIAIEHSTLDASGQTMNYTIGSEYSGRLTSTTTQSSDVLLTYPDAATILDTLTLTGTSETGLVIVTVIAKE